MENSTGNILTAIGTRDYSVSQYDRVWRLRRPSGSAFIPFVYAAFPQVAGLKFTWDASVAAGEGRVQEVMVMEGDSFVPIDPEKVYGVVTNNYMRGGGDGYRVFRGGMNAYDYGPGLEVVVADYMAAQGDYTPYTDGRISQE
ncbi:MAG: 5'-nucleotidase C-terminal domain-containing protein, partial [Pseudomonadota bacterium]